MIKRNKTAVVILLLVLASAAIFYVAAPPYIQAWRTRSQYGSFSDWAAYVRRLDAAYWQAGYSSGQSDGLRYVPSDDDQIFVSNQVIKIDDGVYIVGAYGVTDWMMWLSIYSRHDDYINEDAADETQVDKYRIVVNNAEGNAYPYEEDALYAAAPVLLGYGSDLSVVSPISIQDDKLTLTVEYGEDYNQQKTVTLDIHSEILKDS